MSLIEDNISDNISDAIPVSIKNNKCVNKNIMSKYGFIDNAEIKITDYIANLEIYKDKKILCSKGHELIKVDGIKINSHFRHKHGIDLFGSVLSDWHCEWQSNFPDIFNEISFKKKSRDQIKNRRADIYMPELNTIIEIQNSYISMDEVRNRKNDYQLHNLKIIWIINGNNNIDVKELERTQRTFIEFKYDSWRYQNFILYDFIFIDINEKIYKIDPNKVKNNMIDIEYPKLKNDFIKALKSGTDLWDNNHKTTFC